MSLAHTYALRLATCLGLAVALSSVLEGQAPNRTKGKLDAQSASYANTAEFVEISPESQTARMGTGVNLFEGSDPYWDDRPTVFTDGDFKNIADAGFKTVRVPLFIIEKYLNSDGTLAPKYLAKIDHLVDIAVVNHLEIILDEHDYNYCASNAAGCAVTLPEVWSALSRHYRQSPNNVLFELFNEPNGEVDAKVWNEWIPRLLKIVRATNPTRNVILGPATWNDPDKLPTLELPASDHHIIATFHYYLPFEFTHQGASWAGPEIQKLRDVRWTGTPDQLAAVNKDFDMVSSWAKEHNRPIFLGEFGAYGRFNNRTEDRAAWTRAVSNAAADRGFARAIWHYEGSGDFGIHDHDKGWVVPLERAVLNE